MSFNDAITIQDKMAQNQPIKYFHWRVFPKTIFEASISGSNLPSIYGVLEVKTEPKIKDLWGRTNTPKFLFFCLSFPQGFKL